MTKDKGIVISIVVVALLCSALPVLILFVMGTGGPNGMLWDQIPQQLDRFSMYVSMTLAKLMNGSLLMPLIGLALSLYYLPRNRKKFQLTAVSFALFLAWAIFSAVLLTWLEISYTRQAVAVVQRAAGYTVFNCASMLVNVLAWTILLFAIFSSTFNVSHEQVDIK